MDLHGDQVLAADLFLEAGLRQQHFELGEDVLLRTAAHVREPDLRRHFLSSLGCHGPSTFREVVRDPTGIVASNALQIKLRRLGVESPP